MGLTRKQVAIVAVLLSGAVLVVLNQTLLSPALPVIMADQNVDAPTVQWLTSGYSLVEAIVIPLSAYLVGRFPTRTLFIAGMSLFAIGSLCAALSPVFAVLLLGRILQASACGVVMPMVFTVIMLVFPRERRGSAMGLVSLCIGFAPAIGPSVSGLLVDSVGWRALFVLVMTLTIIIIAIASFVLESYGDFEPTTFDKPSVILCSLGLLSLLYGLATVTKMANVAIPLALIAVGVVLIALFVRRQLALEVPLLKVDVLGTRKFAVAVIVVASLMAALVGMGVLLPIYLQNLLGVSALQTGLIMLPGATLGALVGYFSGQLFDKMGPRKIIIPGATIALIGGIGLVFLSLDTPIAFIVCVYTCIGVGMQGIMTPINTWGLNALENRVIQHANALSSTLMQVGASLGTAILVSLSTTSTFLFPDMDPLDQAMAGDRIAFCFTALIMLSVFLIAVFAVRDTKAERAAQFVASRTAAAKMPTKADDEIPVKLAMSDKPYYVHDIDTVRDVAQIMAATKTSGVPIVTADNVVVGFVSDGDIMKYIGRNDAAVLDSSLMLYRMPDDENFAQRVTNLLDLNIMRIATKNVISVCIGDPIDDACRMMAEKRIKKAPVIDEDGRLAGTLSRSDVIRSTMANLASIESLAKKES